MQSLKHEINIYNEDNPNRMLHYVPIKNKGLDNSNERDILINKIEKLTLKNAALEEHASNLQNNVI